jgi:predicted adenylyl cyclase CyaB
MARNIEIKARIASAVALRVRAAALANGAPTEIAQDDTFFRCDSGRLKLRTFADGSGELIFYRRADQAGPKESFYVRSATAVPDSLREALDLAYGSVGRVVKRRTLYLVGRTRVHVDRVQGLGDFLELEVVLQEGETTAQGVREAEQLMTALGVDRGQLIEEAYVDLLARQTSNRASEGQIDALLP